jgi:hypothetical protein
LKSKEEVELTREELAELREKSKKQHHEVAMNEYVKEYPHSQHNPNSSKMRLICVNVRGERERMRE